MSRNEIRLRRQRLTARGTERFRNYGAVLKQHEQEVRMKRIIRVFSLFAVILILVMLIVIVVRFERKANRESINLPSTNQVHIENALI
jgi:cell division septal protein FtsQ